MAKANLNVVRIVEQTYLVSSKPKEIISERNPLRISPSIFFMYFSSLQLK